ncbi:hypothetical protein M1L60_27825 [Actinoplanes sp. TRM 88003]|uniref:Uncharacterized protein n=1 Tax=Paractinoplanes aksuensis TaxID=2939490 RepID=A0ABT1DU89_9ACTN|nr:hypothetical protein [Actinoplanes aksuensis]MCO8274414.1 hypothetical protein [Actinoplanes aksuensis]
MPSSANADPMRRIAQQVADCFAGNGYAFVEDDQLDVLAAALSSFLVNARIAINVPVSASTANSDQGMRTSSSGTFPARWVSAAWAKG